MKNAAITILLSCISSTLPVSSAYLTIDDASKSASLWLDAYFQVLVDVRSPSEWALGHLPNATFIPIETTGLVFLRVKQWDFSRLDGCEDCHIAIYCHSGVRSKLAADYLEREGFRNVYDVLGIQQWTKVGVELVSDKEDQDPTCCYVSCQASVTIKRDADKSSWRRETIPSFLIAMSMYRLNLKANPRRGELEKKGSNRCS